MSNFKNTRTGLRSVSLITMVVVFLLLTLPGYPRIARTFPKEPNVRKELNAAEYDIEGTWYWHANYKDGNAKHTGTFVITKFTDGYHVTFKSDNDNPDNVNIVKYNGHSIILPRDLSPYKSPEDGQSSQTWRGVISECNEKDEKGKDICGDYTLEIKGRIIGASMEYLSKLGYDTNFTALK